MTGPLTGRLVLDFGQGVAGPYCAMLLGDLGATVVKVEPPRGDWGRNMGTTVAPGMGTTFLSVNRGKQSLCLDMRQQAGLDLAGCLARKADIVVESFRPGVMDRLGLSYAELSRDKPSLIYCSISGYGPEGPSTELPAGDSIMQAYGGLMSINGDSNTPPLRVGNVVSDMLAGLFALSGVLSAVLMSERTGRGDHVKTNLLDALVAFQAPPLVEYLATGKVPERNGSVHPLLAPSGTFATADGEIVLTVLDHQWPAFCRGLGLEALLSDDRFADNSARLKNRVELTKALAPAFNSLTKAEAFETLRQHDVLCAPINDYPALVADPQVQWNGLVRSLNHPAVGRLPAIASPFHVGSCDAAMRPPPRLGEDGYAILNDLLDCREDEIARLVEEEAVILNGFAQEQAGSR